MNLMTSVDTAATAHRASDGMTGARKVVRLAAVAAVSVGVVKAVGFSRQELVEPIDRTGAGVPLEPAFRAPIGATGDAYIVPRTDEPVWITDLAGWNPSAPKTLVGRLLAYVWAAPSTLGGLFLGLLSLSVPHVRDGVLVFAGVRGPVAAILKRGRFAATTLGHVVIVRGTPNDALMAHELAHTRQAERLGPFTGPFYWYLLARFGYVRHPLERSARIAGRRARLIAT